MLSVLAIALCSAALARAAVQHADDDKAVATGEYDVSHLIGDAAALDALPDAAADDDRGLYVVAHGVRKRTLYDSQVHNCCHLVHRACRFKQRTDQSTLLLRWPHRTKSIVIC